MIHGGSIGMKITTREGDSSRALSPLLENKVSHFYMKLHNYDPLMLI